MTGQKVILNNLMQPELYTKYLKHLFYGDKLIAEINKDKQKEMLNDVENEELLIPKKKDGSEYDLKDLNHEQRIVVICALEAMINSSTMIQHTNHCLPQ